MTCDGWVRTLRGDVLLFTGKAFVHGEHMERVSLRKRTSAMGGANAPDRSRRVTVLVHGDLNGKKVSDPRRGFSQKLTFVYETMRALDSHIHVIDDAGFGELLLDRPAPCYRLADDGGRIHAARTT